MKNQASLKVAFDDKLLYLLIINKHQSFHTWNFIVPYFANLMLGSCLKILYRFPQKDAG